MLSIADHTAKIDQIAAMYEASSGDDPQTVVIDLLADTLLWCMTRGIDFDRALGTGRLHAHAEWNEAAGKEGAA
jgi:hypothetical protein